MTKWYKNEDIQACTLTNIKGNGISYHVYAKMNMKDPWLFGVRASYPGGRDIDIMIQFNVTFNSISVIS